jgi:hypothetical protein
VKPQPTTNEGSSFIKAPEKISHWIQNDMDYSESCGRFESCGKEYFIAAREEFRLLQFSTSDTLLPAIGGPG